MSHHHSCPECGSDETSMIHIDPDTYGDIVVTDRGCADCDAIYTVEYGNPIVTNSDSV